METVAGKILPRYNRKVNHPLRVTYRIEADASEIEGRAEALMLEQTVELPRTALAEQQAIERVLGEVEEIIGESENHFRVSIAYPLATLARDPAQLLNVVFGNSSLQPDVTLVDLDLPDPAFEWLPGPRAGIAGIRALTGVSGRPLLATALKPMGLDPEALAGLCAGFARAGLDLIKDDHGLADHDFSPFERRVTACLAAIEDAARDTGHRALYVPNLLGTPERVMQQLTFARQAGARAVMLSPMLLGLPLLHQLASMPDGIPIVAHPSFGGVLRADETVLFGKIFRWYGADGVIFPHAGGRFSYSLDTCNALAAALRAKNSRVRDSFPMPAGGITLEQVPALLEFYGRDCILLIGGGLYRSGETLFERTRALVEQVARAASRDPAA